MVKLDLADLAKYPFLPEAKSYVERLGIELRELFNDPDYSDILERAYERVVEALEHGYVRLGRDPHIEIVSFPAAIALVSFVGSDLLAQRYATAEAKRASRQLERDNNLELTVYISDAVFNWGLKIVRRETLDGRIEETPMVPVYTYLKYASRVSGSFWSLVSRRVENGYVHLPLRALIRLLEEAIKDYILERFSPPVGVELGYAEPLVARLSELVKKRLKPAEELLEAYRIGEESYPPCIRVMLGNLRAGKGLPHLARFTIVTFLRALGWDVDRVVELFSILPDFNERITRYQVEHIFGLRGSRTVYAPPSCATLKRGNLCYAGGDPICGKVKHPLQYVRVKVGGKAD